MLAFNARSPVWDEISIIVSDSALILSTALEPSIAFCDFSFTLWYISIVRLAACSVFVPRFLARSMALFDASAPFCAIFIIASASLFIPCTLSLMEMVVAAVSSIPAASCCVVAELSVHILLMVSLTFFNPFTLSVICPLAPLMSATIPLRFLRISCTFLAICPVSSFLSFNFLESGFGVKSRRAVFSIICVRLLIGLQINKLTIYPAIKHTTSVTIATNTINCTILLIGAIISPLSAVTTTIILLLVIAYPAYLIAPL